MKPAEWPTYLLVIGVYTVFGASLYWVAPMSLGLAFVGLIFAATLHSSLMHEVLHGHPTRWGWVNALLIFPSLSVLVPYLRFKDTHLAHHRDENLTDPYDDPESNFLDPQVWHARPYVWRKVLEFNNTLFGRMLIGPLLGQVCFVYQDTRAILRGNMRVLGAWVLHIPAVVIVMYFVSQSVVPMWLWGISLYVAMSILKIRTFLEHRAYDKARGRTVVIEDRGLLAFLFLNNNLHVVHHMHPNVPWYDLPQKFAARRQHYLVRNDGYVYPAYKSIFAAYLFRMKDPVAHPLMEPQRIANDQDEGRKAG